MSALDEFNAVLKELPALKAPGVSGTRIKKLTDIAVRNVAEESQLMAALYASCKAIPSSHKLGALYVVDSIVRVYMDEAKKRGETVSADAPAGTFAAGVYRISELVEALIDNALELLITESSNIKIAKLVDIWERAQTFSPELIARIRSKHFASHTPPGLPFIKPKPEPKAEPQSQPPTDSGSILLALASLAKPEPAGSNAGLPPPPPSSSSASQPPSAAAPQSLANNILSQLSALANNSNPSAYASQASPPSSNGAAPGSKEYLFSMLQSMQGNTGGGGYGGPNGPGGPGPNLPPVPTMGQPMMGQPPMNHNGPMNHGPPGQGPQGPQGHMGPQGPMGVGYNDSYNDRRGRDDNGYGRRNRSRSPQGRPGHFEDRRDQNQGFNGSEGEMNVPGNPHYRPRNVGFDNTLPQGSFKVLSRTLFVGGVPRGMDEAQLALHLRPYGEVQSVILNSERKHAFVKVYSRKEAEQVIQLFNKDGSLPLRTRWGVGFGPRDCCNYQHGISIIPIQRLTDADRSWVVLAQWGGTGGQPLQSGVVIDEPDIEIGTGILSKAMSKKMPTNSARNGPKSNRPGESDDQYARTSALGGQQEYMAYALRANPLTGLFNQQQNMPPQAQQPPPQGYPPQGNYQNNGNLSAQLANFFQNGAQR